MNILRKIAWSASLTAMLLGSHSIHQAVAAPAWVQVYTSRNGSVYYVDKNSIEGSGRYRYFWMYAAKANGEPINSYRGQLVYGVNLHYSSDCQSKIVRLRAVQLFDQNSKLIDEGEIGDYGPAFQATSPEGKRITKLVCSTRR